MRNDKGQSLMEVVVALTVGILVVTALTFATLFSLRNANFSKASIQATKLAQEGLEKVRSARDRNAAITGNLILGDDENETIDLWDDPDLWSGENRFSDSGNCPCYFKINSTGEIQYIGKTMLSAEIIAPNFKRAIIISDTDSTAATQKIVTAVVTWIDATGEHESKLTTILRRL